MNSVMKLSLSSCDLSPSDNDELLSQDDFDQGIRSLNLNRSPGHDSVAPEYITHGGRVLLQGVFLLMLRI